MLPAAEWLTNSVNNVFKYANRVAVCILVAMLSGLTIAIWWRADFNLTKCVWITTLGLGPAIVHLIHWLILINVRLPSCKEQLHLDSGSSESGYLPRNVVDNLNKQVEQYFSTDSTLLVGIPTNLFLAASALLSISLLTEPVLPFGDGQPEAIQMGVVGAFTYCMILLGSRFYQRDITTPVAVWCSIQLILGPILAFVISQVAFPMQSLRDKADSIAQASGNDAAKTEAETSGKEGSAPQDANSTDKSSEALAAASGDDGANAKADASEKADAKVDADASEKNGAETEAVTSGLKPHPKPDMMLSPVLVLCFFAGAAPRVVVNWLMEAATRLWMVPSPTNSRRLIPLSEIKGVTAAIESRLAEEGIEDVNMLAMSDPIWLIRKTPFDPRVVAAWIDEAILISTLPSNWKRLQEVGISGAIDLVWLSSQKDANGIDALSPRIAGLSVQDIAIVQATAQLLADDSQLQMVWGTYLTSGGDTKSD